MDVLEHLVGRTIARRDLFLRRALFRRLLRVRDHRLPDRRQPGLRRGMALEYADQIVPRPPLVTPDLDQPAVRVLGQGAIGVRIEAIAIDGMAMDRALGGRDQKDIAPRLQDSDHLGEGEPEELAVLQHLARKDQVDGRVVQRKLVGILERYRDLGSGGKVGGQVAELRIVEDRPETAVDVGAADIQDRHGLLSGHSAALHVAPVALVHVLE